MKLYFFPVAPNPTKVRLYLAEKKLALWDESCTESVNANNFLSLLNADWNK